MTRPSVDPKGHILVVEFHEKTRGPIKTRPTSSTAQMRWCAFRDVPDPPCYAYAMTEHEAKLALIEQERK